ncbi:MAG: C40 family peptidase [Solirubrobacterales bacterium]|nr:C40 family peptidase [Solirubrobacterales bacterium]
MGGSEAVPVKKAKIVDGHAVAPSSAPLRVKRVIAAANKIDDKPYIYGGGHASFKSKGYDCSGSVSYALHGGRFIKSPMPSTGYMKWKKKGAGAWITVYSNPGHMYMVVAGLRFDTSMTDGDGPGWSSSMRSTAGRFKARHPKGY